MNDLLDGCQSDSGPWEIAFMVKTLKRSEKPIGKFHVESRAVVAHEVDCLACVVLDAKFDLGIRAFGSKFPCIAKKVFQHNS
jgi:hypothetical protein